jgi:hypothetical protein
LINIKLIMHNLFNKYDLAQQGMDLKGQLKKPVEEKSFLKRIENKFRMIVRPDMRLVPATLAVLIQFAALITVAAITWTVNLATTAYLDESVRVSLFTFVLLQAAVATTFCYIASMASWWRWIHLCFPIAAWVMFQWHIPNGVYLVGFMISLSLFWTTFRTQVPFFPSRPMVWQQVAKIIPQNNPLQLIDIGSGLGDMSMYMARTRPDCQIEGIEIAPLPWMISYIRAKFCRSRATFLLGNYQALDFANYDVIFAYLSPVAMGMLWEKASQEMRSGSLLISLEFEIPGVIENMRIAGNENSPSIYVWKIA